MKATPKTPTFADTLRVAIAAAVQASADAKTSNKARAEAFLIIARLTQTAAQVNQALSALPNNCRGSFRAALAKVESPHAVRRGDDKAWRVITRKRDNELNDAKAAADAATAKRDLLAATTADELTAALKMAREAA